MSESDWVTTELTTLRRLQYEREDLERRAAEHRDQIEAHIGSIAAKLRTSPDGDWEPPLDLIRAIYWQMPRVRVEVIAQLCPPRMKIHRGNVCTLAGKGEWAEPCRRCGEVDLIFSATSRAQAAQSRGWRWRPLCDDCRPVVAREESSRIAERERELREWRKQEEADIRRCVELAILSGRKFPKPSDDDRTTILVDIDGIHDTEQVTAEYVEEVRLGLLAKVGDAS